MSNSKLIEASVSAKPCVMCGSTEFDLREIVEAAEHQDDEIVGNRYHRCQQCKSMYEVESDNSGMAGREEQ